MHNYKLIIITVLFSLISPVVYADEDYIQDCKILALKQCIYSNERELGTYHDDPNIRDYTIWTLPIGKDEGHFSVEGTLALTEYVKKMTGDFYKFNYRASYKTEGYQGKITHIFGDCYRFHQSPELDEFLRNTPP